MLDGLLKRLTVVCSAIIYYTMLSHVHVQLKDLPVAFYTLKELSSRRLVFIMYNLAKALLQVLPLALSMSFITYPVLCHQ